MIETHAVAIRRLDHPIAFFESQRHRLVAEDLLPVVGRNDRMLGMQVVGRQDVYGIHVRALTHGLNGAIRLAPKLTGEPVERLLARIGRGGDSYARVGMQLWQRVWNGRA